MKNPERLEIYVIAEWHFTNKKGYAIRCDFRGYCNDEIQAKALVDELNRLSKEAESKEIYKWGSPIGDCWCLTGVEDNWPVFSYDEVSKIERPN